MHTEIFNLAQRDRLVLGRLGRSRLVIRRERSERANVDFASGDGAVRVNLSRRGSEYPNGNVTPRRNNPAVGGTTQRGQ